jgi:8-oxo-dGTP diphosphatase
MRLILVRHGQAGRKSEWQGDDALRPLDSVGRRQAGKLVKALARGPKPRVVSSPYVRCQQTLEPLSADRGLETELTDALAPDGARKAMGVVEQLIRSGAPVVVACTHREVLVELLPALSKKYDVKLGHRLPGAKGSHWVLEFSAKNKLTSVKYQAPSR